MKVSSRWTMLAATVAMGAGLLGMAATPGVSGALRPVHAVAEKSAPGPSNYYLSLGDSYSQGYETSTWSGGPGYTDAVARKDFLNLVNFGCGGATTTSILNTIGCPGSQEPTYGVAYPTTTQATAALNFIADPTHHARVNLITISISGNDVTSCAGNSSPVTCVLAANSTISTNVSTLVTELRAALVANGDSSARIVGLTYPDVLLGDDVAPAGHTNPGLAELSVVAFDAIINPTLRGIYTGVTNGSFVNVTDAPYYAHNLQAPTGADSNTWDSTTSSFTGQTIRFLPYGTAVPMNVAEVCSITWYCNATTFGDIHPNNKGYHFIAGLIESDLGLS
jgi:lysophospholipase L1-like esterase